MNDQEDIVVKLMETFRSLNLEPGVPVSIYEIGPPMIAAGFTQLEIADALYALQGRKVITLMDGNRLRLEKPLD